jgi:hypothetical protein
MTLTLWLTVTGESRYCEASRRTEFRRTLIASIVVSSDSKNLLLNLWKGHGRDGKDRIDLHAHLFEGFSARSRALISAFFQISSCISFSLESPAMISENSRPSIASSSSTSLGKVVTSRILAEKDRINL